MGIAWAPGVRTSVLSEGYIPAPAEEYLESEMERGDKSRRTSTGTPELHTCTLRLPFDEYNLFITWVKDVWNNQRFVFPNPLTGVDHDCNFKIVDRKPFAPFPTGGASFHVKFELRIYPN